MTFDDNGNNGSMNSNDMKTAIEAALASGDKTTVTTIKLTGSVTEITGWNWVYLINQFNKDSDWSNLTALDLSGMTVLKTMRNDTTHVPRQQTRLETLILPDSVTAVGERAFYHCKNLALKELPPSLTQIDQWAFSGCTGLALTALPPNLTQIEESAFSRCTGLALTELPASVRQIGNYAFSRCTDLALTALPPSLTQIGLEAFYGCKSLALTALPAGVTQIGKDAFYGCTGLALTALPPNLTQIERSTFEGCTGLALTALPAGVTQIGEDAFYGCTGLALKELPPNLTQIGNSAFSGCTSLALTALPPNLTQIENYAFSGCTDLALTALPAGVRQIGDRAFWGCKSLAMKELPPNLTQIGQGAFSGCTGLALTELPAGVAQIWDRAFWGCTGLDKIIMEPMKAPTLGSDVFARIDPPPTIYVPKNGNGYGSGGWESLNTVEYTPVTGLTLNATTLTLYTNASPNTETLTATLAPVGATFQEVRWESSAPNIAAVDDTGKVTAIAEGTAAITAASLQGGKTAACTVTVKNAGSGGGGSSGGDSSGGGDSGGKATVATAGQSDPANPVLAVIELPVTVGNGTATGKPDYWRTASAIAAAQKDAKSKTNGVAVRYDAKTDAAYDGFSITITRATLERLIAVKVKYAAINTATADLTFDLVALKELSAKSVGDVTLTAAKETELTGNALSAVGSRPAYCLTANYTGKDGKAATVQSFGAGRVTVGLACKPASAEQSGSLFLVYSADKKSVQWLSQSGYDRNSGNVSASVGHFSVYAVGRKPAPAFTDAVNHWTKADIDFAVSRDLLTGTNAASFTPNGAIRRGAFVAALGRLAGIDPAAYPSGRFNDIAATAYYAPYANWAVSKGIVTSTGEKTFSPDAAITREQMAVIMQQYAKATGRSLPKTREAVSFSDNSSIAATAASAVQAMQQSGVMGGKGGNRFAPKDNATRAEAAAVLRRFASAVTDPAATGGWGQNDAGSWLYYENGKPVTGFKQLAGKWHYFGATGLMQTGGWRDISGKRYYFYTDGSMAVNTKIDGYEIGADGARKA